MNQEIKQNSYLFKINTGYFGYLDNSKFPYLPRFVVHVTVGKHQVNIANAFFAAPEIVFYTSWFKETYSYYISKFLTKLKFYLQIRFCLPVVIVF